MFTIKIVDPHGAEYIKQVKEVLYMPPEKEKEWRVMYRDPNNGDVFYEVDEGDIYVMNDNGKTVAAYHLRSEAETN